ncbi:phage major capsid protein [Lysinibacillus sphaericus]|uniref:phage major capsid protein n=1 Tax=Lysinibacillus sphaericus TaxID=1421 RepID=UPI00216172B6|nr:phage major capsid protein [Lysinibacillus sphaericus]MCS1383258.1 phage major capsid protein [Lysinibacillus sphaericus]
MKTRKLLLALQQRNNDRLTELRGQLERNEVRAEDLEAVQAEVQELVNQAQEIADELANLDEGGGGESNEGNESGEEDGEGGDGNKDSGEGGEQGDDDDEGRSAISGEERSAIMTQIGKGLSTRGNKSTKKREQEVRSAFANFVAGKITESEARSLGIEAGNGSVTVPEVVASEVITYAQEENLLRKYGSTHKTKGNVKYPVLVKKADANVNKKERATSNTITETTIEFDEILLSPSEFDAIATVTQKLLSMSDAPIETIVIDELKKAYVRKETNYMFNGDDAGNENPGALAKKSVKFYETIPVDITAAGYSQKLYSQLVKLKGQPVTEVLKKSMWIVNRAALTILEDMTDTTGRPLLHQDATDGVGYKLLGHKLDFTDAADGNDSTKPVFYFGDFKAFHIQDVIGGMKLQKLLETYASSNRVGFKIYNLLDGQLVYSPFEPAVYRYEVGATKPGS